MSIYEITYKENGYTITTRASYRYLIQLESNPTIQIVSIIAE